MISICKYSVGICKKSPLYSFEWYLSYVFADDRRCQSNNTLQDANKYNEEYTLFFLLLPTPCEIARTFDIVVCSDTFAQMT